MRNRLRRSLGFLSQIENFVSKDVNKVVDVVKEHGSTLGVVGGFIVGGILDGPARAIDGMKLGGMIGAGA